MYTEAIIHNVHIYLFKVEQRIFFQQWSDLTKSKTTCNYVNIKVCTQIQYYMLRDCYIILTLSGHKAFIQLLT